MRHRWQCSSSLFRTFYNPPSSFGSRSFRSIYGARGQQSKVDSYQSRSTAKMVQGRLKPQVFYSTVRRLSFGMYTTHRRLFHEYFQIVNILHFFGVILLSCAQSLAIIRYFVSDIAVTQQVPDTLVLPSPVGVCFSTLLYHCVILFVID